MCVCVFMFEKRVRLFSVILFECVGKHAKKDIYFGVIKNKSELFYVYSCVPNHTLALVHFNAVQLLCDALVSM